jgi:hypothetical protein
VSNIGPTGATPALRHTTCTPPKRSSVERVVDRLGFDVGDDDAHARLQEPRRQGTADATGTAGDHADLVRRIVEPGRRRHVVISSSGIPPDSLARRLLAVRRRGA